MPSRSVDAALRDIAFHIDLAASFVVGLDVGIFKQDLKTIYAVTRCLEIISEASRRLPKDMKDRHPGIAWRQMAGAGTSIGTTMKMSPPISCGKQWHELCLSCVP